MFYFVYRFSGSFLKFLYFLYSLFPPFLHFFTYFFRIRPKLAITQKTDGGGEKRQNGNKNGNRSQPPVELVCTVVKQITLQFINTALCL